MEQPRLASSYDDDDPELLLELEFFTNEKSTKHLQLCLDLKKLQDPPLRSEHELYTAQKEKKEAREEKKARSRRIPSCGWWQERSSNECR